MNEREALKLALEAFEWNYNTDLDNIPACEKWAKMLKENITAIREVLAQPEQDPVATVESVATVVSESGNQEVTMSWWHEPALPVGTKLYTTPPQRKPLTDEQWQVIADTLDCLITRKQKDAIEAVIGIKE